MTLVGWILSLSREAVYVFYSRNQLGHSIVGILPLCKEAVGVFYSPADWEPNLE